MLVSCSRCRTSKKAAKTNLQLVPMESASQSSMAFPANFMATMFHQMMSFQQQQQQGEPSSSSRPSFGRKPLAITYPQANLALTDHIANPKHDDPTSGKPLEEPKNEKPLDVPKGEKPLLEMPELTEPNLDVGLPAEMSVEEQAALVAGKPAGQTAKKRPAAAVAAQKKPSCGAAMTAAKAKGGPVKAKPSKIIDAKRGWKVEERIREKGGSDRYYISPHGKSYRIRAEAIAAGFSG